MRAHGVVDKVVMCACCVWAVIPCWMLCLLLVGSVETILDQGRAVSAVKCMRKNSQLMLHCHSVSMATAELALLFLLGGMYASRAAASTELSMDDRRRLVWLGVLVLSVVGVQILYAVTISSVYVQLGVDADTPWALWLMIGGFGVVGLIVHVGLFVSALVLHKQGQLAAYIVSDKVEKQLYTGRVNSIFYVPLLAPAAVAGSSWLLLLYLSVPLCWSLWREQLFKACGMSQRAAKLGMYVLLCPLLMLGHAILAAWLVLRMSSVALADEGHLCVVNLFGEMWSDRPDGRGTRRNGLPEELGSTTWVAAGRRIEYAQRWKVLHTSLFSAQAAGTAVVVRCIITSRLKAQNACLGLGWVECLAMGCSVLNLLYVFVVRFTLHRIPCVGAMPVLQAV